MAKAMFPILISPVELPYLKRRTIITSQTSVKMPIDLQTHKTIRIAVSGDVPMTRLETRIIDTAPFQRLRAIKQLSTASLVYPTAMHTRFDHSLGTLAMALEMLGAIRANHTSAPEE